MKPEIRTIRDGSTTSCQSWAAEKASQQSKTEKHGHVYGKAGGQLEQDENEERPEINTAASDFGHLGHWRP
jgi:hypothetical protein